MTPHRILYNAKCPICSAEIDHYRARAAKSDAPLAFEDLNETDLSKWRLNADEASRRLHAQTADGTRLSGINAFALIWRHLPGME
ncbi:DCC1-like thiol-disulfide oxidoreductase family protein [Gymnodinialimonas sp. 2305UL16-5]|uniref:thiol-disulfide oxidoreductase DCC family protein n=1 Tax=Gymnodinialimonas mytili TaxID=3126503 RepID=UPI00309FEB42